MIIVPTHELAVQIGQQARDLAQHSGLAIRAQALIGGVSMKRQLEKLKDKPQVVVGSPGRIGELIGMGKLKVHTVQTLVIDEMDRLLFGDSLDGVRQIIRAIPRERQMIFVSATEQRESSQEADALAPGLVRVHTGSNRVVSTIEHLYIVCEERDKPDVLRRLLHAVKPVRTIVFVHRNEHADALTAKLAYHGIRVADLHSACDKMDRKKALDDFRAGRATVLIASDLAARGLDVRDVTHIVNLDIPTQSLAYLHRTGRTGRAGKGGCAVSLMTEQEWRLVGRYEQELGIAMTQARLREGQLELRQPEPPAK